MVDRLRMLEVRVKVLFERSPMWTFLLPVLVLTAVFTGIAAAMPVEGASVTTGLMAGAALGVLTGGTALIVRHLRPPVLAGLDVGTRLTVGRIVANGGPVPAEYAPFVVWQADSILRLPYHPVVSSIVVGSSAVVNGWSLVFAIDQSDGTRIIWASAVLVSLVAVLVMTYRAKRQRQRAASARDQALLVLNQAAR
ncbi:hypothetical protein [Actinocrispum sp. NPDC049592]|uniref:hypothetical protein n=1 Tax=Actinocrispum sp. NPDC049592 TaxID=3154835 RepID=UPI0034305725